MEYEKEWKKRLLQEISGVGGWLAFIAFRLIMGVVTGAVALFRMIPLLGILTERFSGFAEEEALAALTVSVLIYIALLAILVVETVFLFRRKKIFIPLYIAVIAVSIAVYALSGQWEYVLFVTAMEAVNIAYLLTSKRAALTFGCYNRVNRAAIRAYLAGYEVDEQSDAVLREIEEKAKIYREQGMSHEEYDRHIKSLLGRL